MRKIVAGSVILFLLFCPLTRAQAASCEDVVGTLNARLAAAIDKQELVDILRQLNETNNKKLPAKFVNKRKARTLGWTPGRDVAFVLSADAVHYGDAGWGTSPYCPFGSDLEGYRQAVAQDRRILAEHLTGPVRAERLKAFLYRCVEPGDVARYRITWCGRFSIPLGLQVADRVARELGGRELRGVALDYGTSVSEASLDDADLRGLVRRIE
jgi:hypothetical protein